MKKFKLLISALVFCAAALSLNSCIKDDNKTKELTPEEISTAFNSVKGDYSGKAITRISTGVNDTVPISWEIENDSLLTIKNIPANMMSYQITNEEIKKALASMPPFDLTFKINYGGKEHLLQVAFYIDNNYSYGQYYADAKSLMMQAIAAGAYIDGKYQKGLLAQEVPFLFTGKKQ